MLLDEYQKALRQWSRARRCNPLEGGGPEALAATQRIEKLEWTLRNSACEQYELAQGIRRTIVRHG